MSLGKNVITIFKAFSGKTIQTAQKVILLGRRLLNGLVK